MIRHFLALTRPFTLLAPIIGFISGAVIASGTLPGGRVLVGALVAAVLNAASNALNQYYDIEIDRINKSFRPLPSGHVSLRAAMCFAVILYCLSLVIAFFLETRFFIIVIITVIMTVYYSVPPLRIKRYPFLSNIWIAIPRGVLLIVAGWSLIKPITSIEPWFVGSIFGLYIAGAASTKDFSDVEGDNACGIRTLPSVYGPAKAANIIAPFLFVPFLLIPLGVLCGVVPVTTLPITALAFWGMYTARLLVKNPEAVTIEKNHISWKHMYLILVVGQIGFACAGLFKS